MRGGAVSPAALSALKHPLSRYLGRHLSTSSRGAGVQLGRSIREASTVAHAVTASHFSHHHQLFEPGVILKGYSGREYTIENVLQDRQDRQVYLARANEKMFVLKSLFENEYNYALPLQLRFNHSPYLRALRDTVPDQKMFVNEYMTDHLLNFAFKDLSVPVQKRVLRDTLRGLATLHDQNIAHLDIKANNIMVDYRDTPDGTIVDRVQLSDLEDSTHIPPGQALRGLQVGNQFWRSPEAHVQGAVGKPSDIFSLAIVFIFMRLRMVIFRVDSAPGADLTKAILDRQISTFAEWNDIESFIEYLGRSHPMVGTLRRMADSFGAEKPRRPFSLWKSDALDPDFKDLITKMTNFDPRKRITAQEALDHVWFHDVPEL
ncbi:kinase-like protein [Durotheca rogersii]|uniref:kinase-like protein n=1 Tax=Durotheca rogersii TaxID=419775 RepID=UPI00221E53FF|nr:kinase-like protein [Durotheca rogersii]KAI5863871.1 kinase-like protein [Durotheca rogersii]